MNMFGISFLLTAVITLFVGTFVLYKDIKNPLNWLFFLLLAFIGEDAIIEFHLLRSQNFESAQSWVNLIILWPLILAFLMHFTLTFFREEKRILSPTILLICYAPAILFIVLEGVPGFIDLSATQTRYGWTYKVIEGKNIYANIMNGWTSVVSLLVVVVSLYYVIKKKDEISKKRALLIFIGNVVITIGAIISNVFLVRFGKERIPNTTMFGFLIGTMFLGVGAWRYKMLNISINAAANSIVDVMPEALFLLDRDMVIVEFNPVAMELTGFSAEGLRLKKFPNLFEENCKDLILGHLKKQKENKKKTFLNDLEIISSKGELIPITITLSGLQNAEDDVEGFICIVRDLKEIKQSEAENKILQSQLYQSQKMESIGRLAGGIAHDFNNMLAAISGYAEMIHRKFADDNPKLKKYIGIIEAAAGRSAELTSKLLTFARKGNVELKVLNVHEAITESISILEHTMQKNIKLDVLLDAESPVVFADLAQLQNMFLNFCVNARDAMPDGGTLTIKTENIWFENHIDKISHITLTDGEYICVSFIDTGIGMTEDVREKVFEPFFTTKEQGKGTGLGLASAFGTVHSLGGAIEVQSELNVGTTFKILIPCTDKEISSEEYFPEMEEKVGDGRILIVDDEDVVRSVALDMCRNLGYDPISASNTKSALIYYKKHFSDIALVVMDVIMPEMDGPQCYKEMKKINPNIKIIFASGFTKDGNIESLLTDSNARFLQKPYRGKELSKVITELLS